ncbi:hypothetical protein APR50_16500 [Variovorax paradoxus]|jgi:hypothetical protein|uniref:hypothetical protein n=1 Tax=Variovorax paradoxus TaxID=34073 RepID=UPI0006E6152D|nr:hypothetical protein APR52_06320 [Variovorax paradoxus]KPV06538.1 hypothetical protein APR50_16500 [Variovorax paradoxus]KPV08444.1 hypothetical protein APR49_15360 [Variovorax paradoxus]KPV21952.1 hypothetical protein APR51_12020 [Variovorax paradoxus]KPV32031.1 hypothetical protein APR48_15050 [Variovorax paradoxus]
MTDTTPTTESDDTLPLQQDRLWRDERWTARIIKNEEDDGWAVEMTRHGDPEPALVGPWTMGRDKKNPKPLDGPAFSTLVKTAAEVIRRHEQQLHATLNRSVTVSAGERRIRVALAIVPDEDNPSATLSAFDEADDSELARVNVPASFKLSATSASAWIDADFARPR